MKANKYISKIIQGLLLTVFVAAQSMGSFPGLALDSYNFGVKTVNGDAADIDHDGDLDFITSQTYFGHFHFTRNDGANGLVNGYITNYVSDGKFIDFDGDGFADIVNIYNYGGVGTHGLQFRQNNQAGGFTHLSTMSATDLGTSLLGMNSIAVGDYDNDGDEDLLLAGSRSNQNAVVLQNDGSGNFTEAAKVSWGNGQTNDANEAVWADFNGDGLLDFMILIQSWDANQPLPMVWQNTGSGFQAAYTEPSPGVGLWTRDGSAADLDGDGDIDIVAQGSLGNGFQGVLIYENTGNFTFTRHQIYDQTGMTLGGVRAADFDSDGDMDLVTTTGITWDSVNSQRLLLLENLGGLNFNPGWEGSTTTGTLATAISSISWVGDAEGDGDLEVLTGEYYSGFLWGFNSPPVAVPHQQTFTIYGANGNPGDIDPYSQSLPAGATTWQPVYLTGWHPWGFIPNTNSWVNFDPDNTVGINTRTPYRIRFMVPADFTNPSLTFNLKADNRALIWINDTFIDSVDGQGSPAVDATIASQALHPGLNEIRLTMVDWGGIVGFNYRIDVTMTSAEDISGSVLTNGQAAALNNPPIANAGPDQNSTSAAVTLDGSGSSDPDGNLLIYSWSIGGTEIAIGVNPTVNLADGTHDILLTVSDGELSATDNVLVTVSTGLDPYALGLDPNALARTPWEKHSGLEEANGYPYGVVPFNSSGHQHGWEGEYAVSTVPGATNQGWGPAPDGNTIGFYGEGSPGTPSLIDDAGYSCQTAVDFTYFQTFVNVPANTSVTQFSINFNGMDDGSRITIYNSTYPGGIVDPGSYVYLGGSATANLASYVTEGVNRIVVTQVDDCPGGNTLAYAQITLNGASVSYNTAPTADAGVDQSFDCVVSAQNVQLDGSGSSDPEGDALTYVWTEGSTQLATGSNPVVSLGIGDHTLTLTVSDGEFSASDQVVIAVNGDTEPPVLTLTGNNPIQTICLYSYTDPGVTVSDNCDLNPTVTVTSTVDTNAVGSYEVTYTATDASGNSASITRTVDVINHDPVVSNPPAEVVLSYGEADLSATVDLSAIFSDPDGHSMTFSAGLDSTDAVAMTFDGTVVTVSALDLGSGTVNIGATDACGGSVTTQFTVTVNVTEDLAGSVVFALSQAELKKETDVVSGNLVVNNTYADDDDHGDSDDEEDDDHDDHNKVHYELKLDKEVTTAAGYFLKANGVQIKKDAQIGGDVFANVLDNKGDILGAEYSPVTLPVFSNLPPFKMFPGGATEVKVKKNKTVTLVPGDYGKVEVGENGRLNLTGGEYHFKSIKLKKKARLRFEAASQVTVVDKFKAEKQSYVGPADGALIDASGIIFYVAGEDKDEVEFGERSQVFATVYAPTSEIKLKKEVDFTGALYGKKVHVDKEATLTLDSYFGSGSGVMLARIATWEEPAVIEDLSIPSNFTLHQNYPNPFNPTTTLSYELGDNGPVRLTVYDLTGREIATIVNQYQPAGRYTIQFDGSRLSSGTYLVVLTSENKRSVKKMTLLK
jgi:hypothetical protein